MDKLIKSINSLNNHYGVEIAVTDKITKETAPLTVKERQNDCKIIVESVTLNNVKTHANFNGVLVVAVETLLQVCGDEDSNVRMTADECLNRVCSDMHEAQFGKLLLEFYKEVKRNGSGRSVRAAITRFSDLCHRIRPNKCRPFIINLLPALSHVLKREDDVIHECLPQSLMVIFKVLRVFINDNELRSFVEVLLENLSNSSATIRRTSAFVLQATVKYSNNPVQSVKKQTLVLLGKLKSQREDKHLVLGVLTSLRHMLMVLAVCEDEEISATEEVKQIFEACLYFCLMNNNSIVTSSLETLQELLVLPARYLSDWIQNANAFPSWFWLTKHSTHNLPDILVGLEEGKQEVEDSPLSQTPVEDDLTIDEDGLKLFDIHEVPSTETAKMITRRFLLSTGCLTDDSKVRVSVKALALSCVASLVNISPPILLINLPEANEQSISDVLLYSNHGDPRMRGITANLAGNFIKSTLLMNRNPALKDELSAVCSLIHSACDIIKSCLFDESNATVKEAVSAISTSLDALLNSRFYELGIDFIFCLLSIMPDAYWLTKVDALDVLANINFYVLAYHEFRKKVGKIYNGFKQVDDLQTMVLNEVLQSLEHDDIRVRNTAAEKIPYMVEHLFFTRSKSVADIVTMNVYKQSAKMFDCVATNCQSVPTVTQQYYRSSDESHLDNPVLANNLSHIVTKVSNQMFLCQTKSSFHGCLTALLNLSHKYPILQYGAAWGCGVVPEMRDSKNRDEKMGFLPLLLCYFNSTWSSTDLAIHSDLLLLVGNYLTGLVIIVLKFKEDLTQDPQPLGHEADVHSVVGEVLSTHVKDFFKHLTQILAMFHFVISGQSPVANKVLLPSISAPSLTSPIKKKDKLPKVASQPSSTLMKDKDGQKTNTAKDENEKEKTKNTFSSFIHIPEKLKLFELVKSTYDIYKSTTCADDNDRFLHFVTSAMDSYCQLLEVLAFPEVSRHIEEILTFVNTVYKVQPTMSILCIEQLLKALFGNNLLSAWESKEKREQAKKENQSVNVGPNILTQQPTFYHYVYQYPLNQLTMTIANASFHHYLQSEGQLKPTKGWFVSIKKKMEKKLSLSTRGSSNETSSVQSYIRLFESIVIRSLKTYTITANVQVQIHVLNLLSQLVQLRVNYCLLDADQIFIGFIIKQFELIESGQISQSEELVPNIFFFLVLLSYECYHSKTVITMPAIIQLCDRIMASGRNSFTHAVPALRPLIHDLFVARGPNKQEANTILLTQQEVVQAMLLRILQFPQVIKMVTTVLHHYRKEDTTRWKKFSRQVTDLLLPMLRNMQMKISNVSDVSLLHCLFEALSPIALRPVDLLLNTMLISPTQLECVIGHQQWLVKLLVLHRVLLYHFKENVIMDRIQQLGVKSDVVCIHNLLKLSQTSSSPAEETKPVNNDEDYNLLALTWLQAIAFTCVRLSEELHQPTSTWKQKDSEFLVQLLSESLLVLTYTTKSGTFTNFSKSCHNFLQSNSSSVNGFYSASEITAQFLLLSSEHPVLLLLWQQFLYHIKLLSHETWKQVDEFNMHFYEDCVDYATPTTQICNLNLAAVQYGSLIAFSEHFTQGNVDVGFIKEMLNTNLLRLLSLHAEPPVQDLMGLVKHNKELEKHLIDKLLNVIMDTNIQMDHKLHVIDQLFSCYGTNENDMAAMLDFCAQLIQKKALKFIFKYAYRQLSSRINLYVECQANTKSEMIAIKLQFLRASFKQHNMKSNSKVLDKLAHNIQMKDENCDVENTEMLPNESWYESVITKHGQTTKLALSEFGDIVGILDEDKITDILYNKGKINMHFAGCVTFGVKEITKPIPSQDGKRLFNSILKVLRKQLQSCISKYPQIIEIHNSTSSEELWETVKYNSDDYTLFCSFCDIINDYLLHIHILLKDYHLTKEELNQSLLIVIVFGKILQGCQLLNNSISGNDTSTYLKCVRLLMKMNTLDRRDDWMVFAIADTYIELLENYIGNIKYSKMLLEECVEKLSEKNRKILNQMIVLPQQLVGVFKAQQRSFKHLPCDLQIHFLDALWEICRCDTFNSFIRVPSFVWKMGWQPDTIFPKIPEPPGQYLQDKDVLADYVTRINFLGYKNRTQFEETWTNLLGVLVSQPVAESIETGKPPEDEEVEISCLAIRGLTSLVLKTRSQTPTASNNPGSEQSNIKVKHMLAGRQMLIPQNILQREVQNKLSHAYSQATNHRYHHPWNGLNFLAQDNFLKWLELKTGHVHTHQTQYEVGQFSLTHLLQVLGINLEEAQRDANFVDVFDEECSIEKKPKQQDVPEVDVHSCVQFLVDLFTDWFRIIGTPNQQNMEPMFNVPRQLICECVRSILLISDFFTERRQFDWMITALQFFTGNLEMSDEIILQYLVVAMCKAGAVLGMEAEICDIVTSVVQSALSSNLLSCQLNGLLGAAYVLQCEPQLHMQGLVTTLHTFITKQMSNIRNLSMQNIEFIRALMVLAFRMIEKWNNFFTHEFIEDVVQTCLYILSEVTCTDGVLEVCVCHGLQRLVLTMSLTRSQCHVLSKLMSRKLQHDAPGVQMNLMLGLLLTCMYNERLRSSEEDETDVEKAVEMRLIMMEHTTTLLSRVRNGIPEDCLVICRILPPVLDHFFSPQDVLNKVIGEFASSRQPFPHLMATVLFEVFQLLHSRDQGSFVREWVMLSLGNFVQRSPLSTAIWSLTCIFICASTNAWLKPLLPFVPNSTNCDECTSQQIEFLCMASADFFFNQLTEELDRRSFQSTFQSFGNTPDSPYSKLLNHLGINGGNKDLLA